ncbi:MAG: ABC-2 transporter permease [Oscillospiraceae bacterium]|jgi:ABC-2 type transport system permease protein
MLLHLIKKDFVIAKKYVWFMFIVVLLIPPFILWRMPKLAGSISFVISAVFAVFMLLMYVSMKEFQYPKASVMLCATPYPRSLIVMSKYGFYVVIFAACCVIYWIETLLLPELGNFNFEMVIAAFAGISLLISIYLPIQFKVGYEKTKFFFIVVFTASPILLPQLLKINGNPYLAVIQSTLVALFCVIVALVSLAFLAVSILISIRIYSKKDLI